MAARAWPQTGRKRTEPFAGRCQNSIPIRACAFPPRTIGLPAERMVRMRCAEETFSRRGPVSIFSGRNRRVLDDGIARPAYGQAREVVVSAGREFNDATGVGSSRHSREKFALQSLFLELLQNWHTAASRFETEISFIGIALRPVAVRAAAVALGVSAFSVCGPAPDEECGGQSVSKSIRQATQTCFRREA